MKEEERIVALKNAPFTPKEIDLLTGAERYMKNILNLPLISFIQIYFPYINLQKTERIQKINQIWNYSLAAFHLRQINRQQNQEGANDSFQLNAARLYELEAQRVLGALFPLEHQFWITFYRRQELEQAKLLLALDALYFSSVDQMQVFYQLLLQALKAIIKAHYLEVEKRKEHYQKAKRLLVDLPLPEFQNWLNQQFTHVL